MKGVGRMRRLLSFIFAILITVFAVMPNTYAEAQKDYGNLDMNRWVVIGSNDDSDVLIDKMSIDYKVDYKNHLLCNFWVCYFFYNEDKYTLENTTINYEEKTLSVDAFADYYKSGGLKDSRTYSFHNFTKIIPGSVGEIFYMGFFPKERVDEIKNYVKENN